MWKEYSRDDICYNRVSSMSVIIAVLISALLLSLLCGVLYNFWNYDVVRVKTEDGDYHARLTGTRKTAGRRRISVFGMHLPRMKTFQRSRRWRDWTSEM